MLSGRWWRPEAAGLRGLPHREAYPGAWFPAVYVRHVHTVPIALCSMDMALQLLETRCRYDELPPWTICLVNAFSVVEANRNPTHWEALHCATACLADGLGVALLARTPKIAGADLMLAAARHPELGKMRHVLLGGFGVAYMAAVAQWRAAGSDPIIQQPFIPDADANTLIGMANAFPCDILWVALGCPKQEIWMHENRDRLKAKVVIGVGAAFDFLAERIRRAPRWMQRTGLEAVWRIIQEPKRWRRQVGAAVGFVRLLVRGGGV